MPGCPNFAVFEHCLRWGGGQTHVKICPVSKRPFDIGIRSWPSHEPFRLWALVMTWTAFSILAIFKVRTANFHQIIYNLNPLFVNFNNKQLQDMSKYVAYIWIMELCAYHFTNETVKAIFQSVTCQSNMKYNSHLADFTLHICMFSKK